MTNCATRKIEIEIPSDTADMLEAFAEELGAPLDNMASRVIRDGIECHILLWPRRTAHLGYSVHPNSIAAMVRDMQKMEQS